MNEQLSNFSTYQDQSGPKKVDKLHEARHDFIEGYKPAEAKFKQSKELNRFLHLTDTFLGRVVKDSRADSNLKSLLQANYENPDLNRLHAYVREQYGYYFDQLNSYDFVELSEKNLEEQGDESKNTQLQTEMLIVGEMAKYVAAKEGLPTINNPADIALEHIVSNLVESSNSFADVKDFIINHSGQKISLVIKQLLANAVAAEAIYKADPNVTAYAFRQWLRDSLHNYAKGINIFETPYYQGLIKRCELLGDKENGIGGKIYYGPPGTGKTEFAVHLNRRQGFESRVVSMHYWTDFASLLGESPIPLGLDKATNYQQRIGTAIERYEKMDVEDFRSVIKNLSELNKKKTYTQKSITVDCMLPFTVGIDKSLYTLKSPDELSAEEIILLKEGFQDYLERQFMGASIGTETGEDPANLWVNGEILIAMENRQRVILDEIDKAGPNSLAGISRLLAARSGTEIQLKGKEIKLPTWFKIDATSNEVSLDPNKTYLYDRFNQIYVDYPPVIDELMLAGVWLSDQEGNIILNSSDQQQVVNFFTEILPIIQDNYRKGIMTQPLSLRGLRELCHLLVNPVTKRRTEISVRRALEMVLLEQNAFSKSKIIGETKSEKFTEDMQEDLSKLIADYHHLLPDNYTVVDLNSNELDAIIPSIATRSEVYSKALERITSSPIIRYVTSEAIQGQAFGKINQLEKQLINKSSLLTDVALVRSDIEPEAVVKIKQLNDADKLKKESLKDLESELPILTDLGLQIERNKSVGTIRVSVNDFESSTSQLIRELVEPDVNDFEVADFTSDGITFVLRKDDKDSHQVVVLQTKSSKKAQTEKPIPLLQKDIKSREKPHYLLSPNGKNMLSYTPENGQTKLFFLNNGQNKEFIVPGSIKDNFQFSPDGRFLLVEDLSSSTTLIYDLLTIEARVSPDDKIGEPLRGFKSTDMSFITSKLIVTPEKRIGVSVIS